ncbi:Dihydrolipoyllysine-residue acetyltransferase component of pyruvate dehydrogenase complex [Arthrobacter sp. SO5]|uniref:dihydrolipoamide acetyltransferase family protein n=1 Tax=Arthrobacter sp. SO5 TaxID=1897055 RepID=UPI001E651F04|nr:dihydrolipoamide acetyltransferase family protein [Arthrobacter sp. SO5]MCB5274339.1 Dihydrolipoyllysine-residue acetyltransferase component of pyruvate dehydrogenase complex [Arthrobacter sp. SO5]
MSATMIKEFRLPDLGEGLTESEIVAWKVAVGDTVALNQIIAEVETAKAVVELPSPFAGVITALHEQPGTVVEVGKPIVSFEVEGDDDAAGSTGAGDAAAKREPNLVGYGAVLEGSGRPARRARSFAAPAASVAAPVAPLAAASVAAPVVAAPAESRPVVTSPAQIVPAGPGPAERPRSTPPVRKLAKDLGVSLEAVTGTGDHGLITRDDVRNFVGGGDLPAAAQELAGGLPQNLAPAPGARETRTPIKGVRKFTAAAMVSSAFTAPHVTEFLTLDVTPTMELLAKLKASRAFAGYKLTPLTLVSKAVLIALRNHPTLNTRWDEASQEIVQYNYVNLGIAAATPRGLTVPNIKDADRMSLLELSTALTELTDTARAGKTSPANLSGGTISITNIGVFGIDSGTPILNPGEAAILALGAVRKMPWEYQDEVALRQVMTLSLSFDHRLVDGEQGSRFLQDLGAILADPGMALAMV